MSVHEAALTEINALRSAVQTVPAPQGRSINLQDWRATVDEEIAIDAMILDSVSRVASSETKRQEAKEQENIIDEAIAILDGKKIYKRDKKYE